VSVADYPFLADHRIGGKFVLPLAFAAEWLGRAAQRLAPGAVLRGLDELRLLKGITVGNTETTVSVWASSVEVDDQGWKVKVELRDSEDLPRVRATALLGPRSAAPAVSPLSGLRPYPHAEIYGTRLFHGPSFQVLEKITGIAANGLEAALSTRPPNGEFQTDPPASWSFHPLAVDSVFKALILWSREYLAAPSLPSRLGSLRLFGRSEPAGAVCGIRVQVRESSATEVTADADLLDGAGQVVGRLTGCVASVSATLERTFAEPANGIVHPPAS
jgi:hypothetical protein